MKKILFSSNCAILLIFLVEKLRDAYNVDFVKSGEEIAIALKEKKYDLIILDEVCVSIYFGLIEKNDVLPFFENKPDNVELILTGRYCPEEFIEKADLVTEMKEVKHYYHDGVKSRRGIES